MNNLPTVNESKGLVSLYELTHGIEEEQKVPYFLKSIHEYRSYWIEGDKEFEHIHTLEDFADLVKRKDSPKYLNERADLEIVNAQFAIRDGVNVEYNNNILMFWESIKEFLEEQARRGEWEL